MRPVDLGLPRVAASADGAVGKAGAAGSSARRRPPADADSLAIAGIARLSTVDWPGKLVTTLFLRGCPWRCTYCHNHAILDPRVPGVVPFQQVRELLARRHGLLDGVVFSGGEPTRQAGLLEAMREVRAAGFGVGLHTGGAYPRALARLLDAGLVDWVGLDVKATPDLFDAITRTRGSARPAYEALRLVLDAGVAVQVRTTVDPTVLTSGDVAALTALLRDEYGVTDHVLQTVRPDGTADEYRAALAAVRRGTES